MSNRTRRDGSRRAFLTRAGAAAAAIAIQPRTGAAEPQSRPSSQARDLGVWVTWYDVPEAGRAEYLSWLHGTYVPALLKRPGYLWGAHYASVESRSIVGQRTLRHTDDPSVPKGNAYILVIGAEDSGVFGKPSPTEIHRALSAADKKMLAMRVGERINVFAEAARVTGPEAKTYKDGMALAPCIQIGSFTTDAGKEEDVLAWYAQARMPAMSTLSGIVRTRKLASVSGWAKEGILYEFGSLEIRNKYFPTFEDPHPEMKTWTERVVKLLLHAPGSPNVARRIWPPVAG